MYKISKIISLPVISLYESEYQGTIYNIVFDNKCNKCKFLYILNDDDNIEKIINLNDIYLVGKNCIFIKNTSCIDLKTNFDMELKQFTPLINIPVYNMKGENIGLSKDVELDDKFNIQNITLTSGTIIPQNQIFNFSKTAIIVNDIVVNISKFKPKLVSTKNYNCVNNIVILNNKEPITRRNTPLKQTHNNNKIITDYRFLMDRTIVQDIKTINGEIIAKKDSLIDKTIVNKASLHGKLIELARYSKKN